MVGIQIGKIRDEIIGVKLVYTDVGNSTMLYLRKGEVLDVRGSRSVVKALCQERVPVPEHPAGFVNDFYHFG